jgi:hypothetical protein
VNSSYEAYETNVRDINLADQGREDIMAIEPNLEILQVIEKLSSVNADPVDDWSECTTPRKNKKGKKGKNGKAIMSHPWDIEPSEAIDTSF